MISRAPICPEINQSILNIIFVILYPDLQVNIQYTEAFGNQIYNASSRETVNHNINFGNRNDSLSYKELDMIQSNKNVNVTNVSGHHLTHSLGLL